ncbi:MAG: SGNH/GDSL hydrolase family protein [Minisyncoccota bacterium]
MGKPESICVFGDSTAWGAWDTEKGGWVNRLWLHIGNRKDEEYVEIYSQSISGGTSETILKYFENEAEARKTDALIFQAGLNDAAFYKSRTGKPLVRPEKFMENILEIIRRAKSITNNIVFLNLRNCDESKTMPVSWIDIYYTNENIEKYNRITEGVCRANNIPVLDIGSFNSEDFYDGLHPNAEGHRKIFEEVKDFLFKQKWI